MAALYRPHDMMNRLHETQICFFRYVRYEVNDEEYKVTLKPFFKKTSYLFQGMMRKTEVQDILQYVGKIKWRWAGHLARFKDIRWSKRTNDWSPYTGRRSRGRPPVRWMDDVIKYET